MNNRIWKIGSVSLLAFTLLIALRSAFAQDRSTSLNASNEFRVCNTDSSYSQTIQSAVDAAQPGDVIKVAAGVYTESFPAYDYNLYITKTVHLFGGYTCANWITRDPALNVVTIRPSSTLISVVSIEGAFGQGAQFTPTIDGFTITGGQPGNHGGGIRSRDANALISNNVISGNAAFLLGGGIWVQRGSPTIQNNVIQNNHIEGNGNGGAIELENTQATVMGNIIASNFISGNNGYGGGIAVDGGGPVLISNNSIISNAAATITTAVPANDRSYGGGVYIGYAPVNLVNNTIINNAANAKFAFGFGGASGYGGGVYIISALTFTLTGNTIASNTASYKYYVYPSGGGLQIELSAGSMRNNLIAGNHANGNILFGNGGGLAIYTSTIDLHGDQILNNTTSINCEGYGGGVYASNSSISIDATRIENNCAANTPFYGLGGALAFFNSPYTLTNNLIVRNRSFGNDTAVGGLFANANSPGLVVNNSIVNNKGQGIRTAAPITLTNNLIMSHTTGISLTAAVPVSVTFNDFYANTTNQRGFSLDFSNFSFNPQLDGNYHLQSASVLIDAGIRSNAPDHDVDNEPRPMLGSSGLYRFDIGADEYPGPAQTSIDLYTRSADLTIIGPGGSDPVVNGVNDWIGSSVLGSDFNGDGRDDLIASAHDWAIDPDNAPRTTGRVFGLFNFGERITGTIDLLTDTASLTVASYLNLQHVGAKLISGDLNADGQRDLMAGSSMDDNGGNGTVTPTVFVFWGGPTFYGTRVLTDTFINTTTRPADFQVRAPGQDFGSFSIKNALASGDLNSDGKADLIIGDGLANDGSITGTGAAFVVFGQSTLSGTLDLSQASADYTLYGPALNADLGLIAVGRVNAGTQIDLIARTDSTAYVILGPLSSGSKHLITSSANITITGLQAGVATVFDLTGDGQDDVILGSGSKVYVIPGPLNSGDSFSADGRSILTLTNLLPSSFAIGDVIGDSRPDLIIEEPGRNRVYVLAGGADISGTLDITEAADEVIKVPLVGILFSDVSSGDLDRDGRSDLIIGAGVNVDSHPDKYKDAGKVFVLYSLAPLPTYQPPVSASITGPTEGRLDSTYLFTATLSPLTTTQPISYTWQATDQSNVAHAGSGISDTVAFNWAVAGVKTITVTADNGFGSATNTLQVTIGAPPASVTINGPTSGIVNTSYSYTAPVTPVTTTQPITYTWQATGQSNVVHAGNGVSDTVTFNWAVAGIKTITVIADNGFGSVMHTSQVVIDLAPITPASVTINGPASGFVNQSYAFTAPVSPVSTTQPITYTWQATGQSNVVHAGSGVSDTVTFNWAVAGIKTITVTADNGFGSVMDTLQVTIGVVPASVTINGPASGIVNTSYSYTAPVTPVTTTQPITYTWQATGQSNVVHAGSGVSDMVNFSWPVTGTQVVTVTADNSFGSVMNRLQITIGWYHNYLPLTMK